MECGDYGNLPVVDVDVQHIYLAKLIKQKWIHGNGLITYVETEDFLGGLVVVFFFFFDTQKTNNRQTNNNLPYS